MYPKFYLWLFLIFVANVAQAQVPNLALLPAQDEFSMEVVMDDLYQMDTIKYSNGAMFSYYYDSLGNRASQYSTPAPPKAELRILDDSIPDTLGLYVDKHFEVISRNSGPVSASNFYFKAYLSLDSILDNSDVACGITPYLTSLSSLTTLSIPAYIQIPQTVTVNQKYILILHIDYSNNVVEYSDTNNYYYKEVFIEPCTTAPAINSTIRPQVCGLKNGQITLSPLTGFDITWMNGSTDTIKKGLTKGSYPYILTNSHNGCQYRDSVFVDSLPTLQLDVLVFNSYCQLSNGSIQVNTLSGTVPYTYSWNDSSIHTLNPSNLSSGFYTVTVSDSNHCNGVVSKSITDEPKPTLSIFKTDASCGLSNGSCLAHVLNGYSPFQYNWSNGATSDSIKNLTPFTIYSCTVTDSKNCVVSNSTQVGNIGGFSLQIVLQNNFLQATISGGTAPFTYQWNTGASSASISQSGAGIYIVTVSDGQGCISTANYQVLSTDIKEENIALGFYVYPNPNLGESITIFYSNQSVRFIDIVDMKGALVQRQKIESKSPLKLEFKGVLNAGAYNIYSRDRDLNILDKSTFVVK